MHQNLLTKCNDLPVETQSPYSTLCTTNRKPKKLTNMNIYLVSIYQKADKQALKNCRTVSLLPICSKIFERLIYSEMFGFFLDKGLISANQSGFKPGDSRINQLLSIAYNIYKSFHDGYEVRGVFLTFQKHLIKSGAMVLYSNYKKMEYWVTY